jgi:SulP family sulfate permease
VVAYRLEGPLFFGAAHQALLSLTEVSDIRVVILRMSQVTSLDATGAAVLADTVRRLEGSGVTVLVSGLDPRFHGVLAVSGLDDDLRERGHLFAHTPEAIAHAHRHAGQGSGECLPAGHAA